MIGAPLSFIYFLPLYAAAFASLAFLPRLRWLLPAAAVAAVLCFQAGQQIVMREVAFGLNLKVLLLVTAGFGFTAGFIARALILSAPAHGGILARPRLILPIVFVATPLVIAGLAGIMIALIGA
jgi:hypothetical protein